MTDMESPADLDLIDIARLARRSLVTLAIAGFVAASAALAVTAFMPRQYAYVALIRSAVADVPQTETRTSYLAQVILGKRTPPSWYKAQGVKFLEFKYESTPHGLFSNEPYVRTVEDFPNNDLFSITVRAPSIEAGRAFTERVVEDLTNEFTPYIDGAKAEIQGRIRILERKIESLVATLRKFEAAAPEEPGKARSADYKLDVEADLISAELELQSLDAASKPWRLRNFSLMDHHPKSDSPESPRSLLLASVVAAATMAITLAILVLREQRRRRLAGLPG